MSKDVSKEICIVKEGARLVFQDKDGILFLLSNVRVERWLHNYRFCCRLGRHHATFGTSGPCDTCSQPISKKIDRRPQSPLR